MYLNKKELKELLHNHFIITWCESRRWAGKKFTDLETQQTEERIFSFVVNKHKKAHPDKQKEKAKELKNKLKMHIKIKKGL